MLRHAKAVWNDRGNRGLGFELEVQSGSRTNPAVHRWVPNADGTKRVRSESNPPDDTQHITNQAATASRFKPTVDPVSLPASLAIVRVCPHAPVVSLQACGRALHSSSAWKPRRTQRRRLDSAPIPHTPHVELRLAKAVWNVLRSRATISYRI